MHCTCKYQLIMLLFGSKSKGGCRGCPDTHPPPENLNCLSLHVQSKIAENVPRNPPPPLSNLIIPWTPSLEKNSGTAHNTCHFCIFTPFNFSFIVINMYILKEQCTYDRASHFSQGGLLQICPMAVRMFSFINRIFPGFSFRAPKKTWNILGFFLWYIQVI